MVFTDNNYAGDMEDNKSTLKLKILQKLQKELCVFIVLLFELIVHQRQLVQARFLLKVIDMSKCLEKRHGLKGFLGSLVS